MNKNKLMTWFLRATAPALAMLMFSAASQAATVSYFLNQSNALPDGTDYLQVTISDGADGAIDFTVEVLPALSGIAGSNFGIQSFAFNVEAGGDAEAINVTGLPEDWSARDHFRMSAFGFFDVKVVGKGSSRVSTLSFSVTGIDGDTPEDYAVLSTGNVASGHEMFAAHVAGFNWCPLDGKKGSKKCVTSGFFAGSDPVPLPAAAWLFATGMAGALIRARKRRA